MGANKRNITEAFQAVIVVVGKHGKEEIGMNEHIEVNKNHSIYATSFSCYFYKKIDKTSKNRAPVTN